MKRQIGKVIYDTDNAEIVKRVTVSYFGDPAGYEEILYKTDKGNYFIYAIGGSESKYPTECIRVLAKAKVQAWIDEN